MFALSTKSSGTAVEQLLNDFSWLELPAGTGVLVGEVLPDRFPFCSVAGHHQIVLRVVALSDLHQATHVFCDLPPTWRQADPDGMEMIPMSCRQMENWWPMASRPRCVVLFSIRPPAYFMPLDNIPGQSGRAHVRAGAT